MGIQSSEIISHLKFAMESSASCGIVADIRSLASDFGHAIAKQVHAESISELGEAVSSFWTANNLGRARVMETLGLSICVSECFDCAEPMSRATMRCSFTVQLLKTIFQDLLGRRVEVTEIACRRGGDPDCVFKIRAENSMPKRPEPIAPA